MTCTCMHVPPEHVYFYLVVYDNCSALQIINGHGANELTVVGSSTDLSRARRQTTHAPGIRNHSADVALYAPHSHDESLAPRMLK